MLGGKKLYSLRGREVIRGGENEGEARDKE